MPKRFYFPLILFLSLSILVLFQGCCQDDSNYGTKPQTTIYFKSLDTTYKIDHLFINELNHSTNNNLMMDKNQFVMPLSKNLITVYCYATSGIIDTLLLNNIYTLNSNANTKGCGDDYSIDYNRTEISVLSTTFDSAYFKNAFSQYDTIFFKP